MLKLYLFVPAEIALLRKIPYSNGGKLFYNYRSTNMTYHENILEQITEAGELLLISGAEVSRIEDTIKRIANAYGFIRADVFSITSTLIVTAHTKDGEIYTISRRVTSHRLDMQRIDAINQLSRKICENPLALEDLVEQIDQIRRMPNCPNLQTFVAYMMASGAFAIFYNGTIKDCIASIFCSIAMFFTKWGCEYLKLQSTIQTIVISMVMCFCAYLAAGIGLADHTHIIIISNIMLLVPGLAFMTSVRDMILGDTITGLLGICEAVIQAFAIAIGCVMILWKFGGGV